MTVCLGFYLRTWTKALDAAKVDQSLELKNPEKVFYPSAIRVKVVASTQGSDAPPTQPTHSKGPGPISGDKTLTSTEMEGPTLSGTPDPAL